MRFDILSPLKGRRGGQKDSRIIDIYACLLHLPEEDQSEIGDEKEECVDITEVASPGIRISSWICYNNIEDLKFGFRAHGAVTIELQTLDMLERREMSPYFSLRTR